MENAGDRATAFKVGFLAGLANQGVLPSELFSALEKQAADDLTDPMALLQAVGGGVAKPVVGLGEKAIDLGLDTAGAVGKGLIAAPVIAGGLAGVAAERLSSPDPKAIETLQKAELIGLYKRLAAKMRERRDRRESSGRVV